MAATLVREPFHRPGWIYEEKYDGWRMLAFKDGARAGSQMLGTILGTAPWSRLKHRA
jgi:hypothetical protein